jgi:signal transduction histidine kinase
MLSFSITSNRKHIGTLYLGDKKSGDPYSKTDILLLETFTKQAGIALEKANLYDKIKEHASTLEQKVSERTKELEVLQREKELLMLEISHGLQTPLTIIKGELFFLKKEGADESRLVTVDSSIDRISHFIYRLLSLAHVEKQEKKELALLPLNEVIEDTLSLFEANIEENAINLHMSLEENVVIEGNKNDLDELISNLISNAIKYIGSTVNKTITLTLTKKGKQAILTIQDTGIGMDEDELKHLFEKFYRVKNSETKGIKGTGLGLAIAKKIIENHRGTVQVMSAKGIGTTFTITFPLAKE